MAFRAAHHIVGGLVAEAEATGLSLDAVPDETIREALRASGDDSAQALALDPDGPAVICASATIEGALARCDVIGGTAPARVKAALQVVRERLAG